ncbi:site-specific integrase [Acinetobacter pittii]|uniref:site-specific integrase n=1 Tax=Acinetobacter pittii TaxID=48296 RepID=UPI001ABFC185|nr:site-specific integrase [Acinetobacter pittii]QDB81958.1 site-specific integrase [Acinetobacter pittii]
MFFIKTIHLSKKDLNENKIALLFDETTSSPCLYPLLYSLSILRYQSVATQQADMLALQFWYQFWYQKYSTIFCESFFSTRYDPEIYISEIDNFMIFLENKRKFGINILRLRLNSNVNYTTITKRMRSLLKYFKYLLDEYWNPRFQEISIKELAFQHKRIEIYLKSKKKIFNKFSARTTTVKNEIKHDFKSLTNEMLKRLYEIIKPNNKDYKNINNPFADRNTQLRNFLIVHLMVNYGLRVGELMLLTTKSFKKSINSHIYNMIVTNTDDEYDNRSRKPSIKNEQSNRVIVLRSEDFIFINMYIDKIRGVTDSEILFTSLKPPYSALSYSAINLIFSKIDLKFKELYPNYFDNKLLGTVEKITPHVCRHTWAYISLAYAINKYRNEAHLKTSLKASEFMEMAKEDLRTLGGWSVNSVMPSHYAKRFIVDNANLINLERISVQNLEF